MHEDSPASELPFHSSGSPLVPGLSGKEAALLSSARVAQAWELHTFIQESALQGVRKIALLHVPGAWWRWNVQSFGFLLM